MEGLFKISPMVESIGIYRMSPVISVVTLKLSGNRYDPCTRHCTPTFDGNYVNIMDRNE